MMDESTKLGTKGMRLSQTTRSMYESMKEAAGGTDDTFVEQLLHIAKLHDIEQKQPEFSNEVKELQKYFSRFLTVYIRMMEKCEDEINTSEERVSEKLSEYQSEKEVLQHDIDDLKRALLKKEQELNASNLAFTELETKYKQLEKNMKTIEDLNRYTMDKLRHTEARELELSDAEKTIEELKRELLVIREKNEEVLIHQKETESELRKEAEELQRKLERTILDHNGIISRLNEDHDKSLHHLRKELEMEAREKILQEKIMWQEKTNSLLNQMTEEHANKIAEIVDKFQDGVR